MTHRLQASTRLVTTATSGAAVVAIADVLEQHGAATWSATVVTLLAVAALLMARVHNVSLVVGKDEVVLRNVLSTHRLTPEDVVQVVPGRWRSLVVLADGRELPTLLRDRDFAATPSATRPGTGLLAGLLAT